MANQIAQATPAATARLSPTLFGPMDQALAAMKQDPALHQQARSCALSLREEIDLRDRARAAVAIERLAGHYPRMERDGVAARFWAEDWLEDTGHLPPCVIEEACAEWRRSTERWMPTPGQLLEKAERIIGLRLAELRRAEELASADLSALPEPREVSEEERRENSEKLTELLGTLRGKK